MLTLAIFAQRWNSESGRIVSELMRRDAVRLKEAISELSSRCCLALDPPRTPRIAGSDRNVDTYAQPTSGPVWCGARRPDTRSRSNAVALARLGKATLQSANQGGMTKRDCFH